MLPREKTEPMMEARTEPGRLAGFIADAAAFLVVAFSVGVAAAWLTHATFLLPYFPDIFQVKFHGALGLLAAGIGLSAAVHGARRLCHAAAYFVVAVGGTALLENLTRSNFGIDEMLVRDFFSASLPNPGRIYPTSTIAFLCMGVALVWSSDRGRTRSGRIAVRELLGLLIFAGGAAGLLGHFPTAEIANRFASYIKLPVYSCTIFMVWSAGLLALAWRDRGERVALWVPAMLSLLFFVADIVTPRAVAAGIAYIPLVFCSLWFAQASAPFLFAGIGTILAVAAYFLKAPVVIPSWTGEVNRLLTVTILWLTAVLIYRHRTAEQALSKSMAHEALMCKEVDVKTALLASIVLSSDDAVIGKSLDGTIVAWNGGAERLFGYTADEIIGQSVAALIPENLQHEETYILSQLVGGKSVQQFETVRLHKTGRKIDIAITVSPIKDENGKIIGASKSARDITQRKRLERALRASERRWVWDLETNTVDWSPLLKELLGLGNPESLFAFSEFESRLHPEDRVRVLALLQAHLNHEGPYDAEYRMRKSDGKYLWVHDTGQAIWDDHAKAQRMVAMVTDFTERKRAEITLRAVVDCAVDGLITIDERGNVESFNFACERLFGYLGTEVLGKNIKMLMPEPDHGRHDGYLSRYVSGGEAHIIGTSGREVSGRRKDGTVVPLDLSISAFELEDGRHFSGIVRDITKKKQAEAEVLKYMRALENSNHELDEFAYAASHDLKAPLRVIDNASKWLEEDLQEHLTPDTQENMRMLRGRVKRMEKLLDDLLEYSRIGRKTDEHYEEPLAGNALMSGILALLSLPEGFRVAVSPAFAGIQVNCMPLQQILMNLISNAIKHHDKKQGCIEVAVDDCGDHYRFAVKDDGPGIAPEFHQRIFKMFQTLKPRDQVEGSGMGLTMVQKHIEVFGGTIALESSEGRGSTFRFTWPKQQRTIGDRK
jgi:two-component system, LuxR family, sensor kinase FixL